jgi:la-related protein 1
MDSRGWIPITLIASFNRVRLLTVDPQLVREVLVLSTMVEVKDDWVRMIGWEQFVLPDALRSTVEPSHAHLEQQPSHGASNGGGHDVQNGDGEGEGEGELEGCDCDCEGEADEDEEEEVVFVMDRESEPWSPERRRV